MSKKLQRASEYFGVTEAAYKQTGAFNPVIGVDSLFFVDPLLLSKSKIPEFKESLEELRTYFSKVITLLRAGKPEARKLAQRKLTLREVKGIGIGYGSESDDGSAIGSKLAYRLMLTAERLIEMGVLDPAIFEVMGLFEEDFGPDRLSDAIIKILLKRVWAYSERITRELCITKVFIQKGYDYEYVLAKHPLKEGPLIFIPEDILRDLPLANSFQEISAIVSFNEELRGKFNSILASCFAGSGGKKPNKSQIKEYLLETKERIKTLVDAYESCSPDAYDFNRDPEGLHLWLEKARTLVTLNPLVIPIKPKKGDLEIVVNKIIEAFKKFIETKGGWRSLYDDSKKPLNEMHARHFFYATALSYCELSDIDISPESNAGQGPVDFKLSTGHKEKIIVEVKLTSGKVRQGYERQTRIYELSEEAKSSYFIVVQITPESEALKQVLLLEEEEEKEGKKHPNVVVVDGREKLSASKVK